MSSPTTVTRAWQRLPAAVQLLLFGLAVYATGMLSLGWFRPSGTGLAIWWPAAGIGLLGALIASREQRPYVLGVHFVATSAINLSGGQAVVASLLLGVANMLEIALIVAILAAGGRDPRQMHGQRDLGRFILAVLAGASFVGVAGGAIVQGPDPGPVLAVARSLFPSHVSALLLLAIPQMRGLPARAEARPWEPALQWLAVSLVTWAVFAPGQRAALVFLVLPVLLWGVLRSGIRAVGLQLVTVAGLSASLTLQGGGPFAVQPGGPVTRIVDSVGLVQVFVVAIAVVVLATTLEVQGRREAAAAVAERDHRSQLISQRGLTGMVDLRPSGDGLRVVESNRIADRFLGDPHHSVIGSTWCDIFAEDDRARLRDGVRMILEGLDPSWHGELRARIGGQDRYFEVALFPTSPDQIGPLLTAQMLDVTERRSNEARLLDLALRDPLTGLANRPLFEDRLGHALAAARRDGSRVGVLFMDLDGFKPINDRFGHRAGDLILAEVAQRLQASVRPGDTVARLGGDEFAVIAPHLQDGAQAERLSARLRDAAAGSIVVDGTEVSVGITVGVAVGHGHTDPHELLHDADVEMYASKPYARG